MSFLSKIFGGGGGGGGSDTIKEQERLQKEAQEHQLAMFKLQQQANRDSADLQAKSAIEKSKHDALMNVANNMK